MDRACPCYIDKNDQSYYKLSNSDTIEIESYLEGFPYPSYDAFTYLMLNKRDYLSEDEKRSFWAQVAFTNYIQHYWPDGYTPPYTENESLFDADYEAFQDVLNELQPRVVVAWNKAVKDCLLAHGDLQFIGMIDIPVISAFLFVNEGVEPKLSPKQRKTLVEKYAVISDKPDVGWLRKLIEKSFNDPHAVESFRLKIEYVDHNSLSVPLKRDGAGIKDIVTLLKRCAKQKLIVRMGDKLDFGPGMLRMHREIFLKLIKEHFDVPTKGINAGFSRMFGYEFSHCQIPEKADDSKIRLMRSIFSQVRKKVMVSPSHDSHGG